MNLWNRLSPIKRGEAGEQYAIEMLKDAGMQLIARNYRTRQGEIDIIMKEKDTLVFVEVRYRKNSAYGGGAESVDYKKQQRLIKTAQAYLQQNAFSGPCRFDVIALSSDQQPNWIKNAFEN